MMNKTAPHFESVHGSISPSTHSLIKRKIQRKFTLFTFVMLALFGIPVVTTGYMVISDIIYHFQEKLFQQKLNNIRFMIHRSHQILAEAGVASLPSYLQHSQQEIIQQLTKLYPANRPEKLFIVNTQAELLLHSHLSEVNSSQRAYLQKMLQQKNGLLQYQLQAVEYYAVFQWVPEWDWLIILSIKKTDLFVERTFYLSVVLLTSLLVLILVLLLSYLLTAGISRKVQMTINYLKAIENGQLQLPPLPGGADEIGLIQASLNQMLDKVASANQALLTEIAHREQVEQELRDSEAYWHLLFEESLSGLVLHRLKDGSLVDANRAYLNIIGYDKKELLDRQISFMSITQPAYLHAELAQLQELRRTGRYGPFEKKYLHRAGHSVPVRLSGLILVRNGEQLIWSNVENITDQKQAEKALHEARDSAERAKMAAETANRTKSTFLANMSHELRTPLNGILGYTQILQRDSQLSAKQQEGVKVIERSGEYLLTLINDILDLSKIEAERIELYATTFNFKQFLSELADLFQMRATQKGIRFLYEPLSELPSGVHTDEKRLRQALINLLSNAIKFTEHGGICLKVGLVDSNTVTENTVVPIRFQVEDTGIGIAENELANIFLPFQQVGEWTHKAEGSGLGLSITKNLIELMGGSLQVHSTPQRGSCFWFVLPLKTASQLVQSVSNANMPERVCGYHGPRKRILVIDDKAENRSVLNHLLTPLGFELLLANDGAQGLQQAEANPPDLVLTDLVMPVLDGFQFTRQLRQHPQLNLIPVIAVSASVFDYHQVESELASCNAFISKPVHFPELLELIQLQLGIEWIYETSPASEPPKTVSELSPPAAPEPTTLTVGPSPLQAQILYELTLMGDFAELNSTADILAQQQPELLPFCHKIQQLAKQFAEEAILALLDDYLA